MIETSRSKMVEKLTDFGGKWDVIIIGGGATGLGIALDAASRGFKTLLLEQFDFAKGTSSRSTKLVHGGVRYLAQGNIPLVYEALKERGTLLRNAPHLVKKASFIVPVYKWWQSAFYTVGLVIYNLLAGKLSFGRSRFIAKGETLKKLPYIKSNGLKGGVQYYDGLFDDSRLAINLAQTCLEQGAIVLNYFRVGSFIKDEHQNIIGVHAVDHESNVEYNITANVVINATGVFTDDILKMDKPSAHTTIQPSQGVHLVIDEEYKPLNDTLMIPKTDDGRVLFAVPWYNKLMLGTTDTLIKQASMEPKALDEEIDFILRTASGYFSKAPTRKDVLSVFAGLRPLVAPHNNSSTTKEISRGHQLLISPSGLITIIGGKWTTYRKMAQDVIDKAIAIGKLPKRSCVTTTLPIHGFTEDINWDDPLHVYGSDKKQLLLLISENVEYDQKLHPRYDFIKAQVIWAARCEMARTLEDVLARRVRLLFLDANAAIEAAPAVADLLAVELKKDEPWKQFQIKTFIELAKRYIIEG